LSGNYDFPVDLGPQEARYRAEGSARAHEHGSTYLSINNPFTVATLHGREWCSQPETSAGAFKQVMIEFAAADPVANRFVVVRFDRRLAHATGEKAGDRLQHPAAHVFSGIDVERIEYFRRDPSAA